jgi:genome maintenance exonuclease 1
MKVFKHVHNDNKLCTLNKIEENGNRHYITPEGEKLPSVTTVLSHFKKTTIVEWRKKVGEEEANKISGQAARRGTGFHKIMEEYLNNEDPKAILADAMPDQKQAFNDMAKVLDEHVDNIYYIEAMLYSKKLGLAGQTDLIAEYDGVLSVIDFKTSSKPKKAEWIEDYFIQCTAYSLMYEDMTGVKIEQIVILMSVDHEQPEIFVKNRKDYVDALYQKIKDYRNNSSVDFPSRM